MPGGYRTYRNPEGGPRWRTKVEDQDGGPRKHASDTREGRHAIPEGVQLKRARKSDYCGVGAKKGGGSEGTGDESGGENESDGEGEGTGSDDVSGGEGVAGSDEEGSGGESGGEGVGEEGSESGREGSEGDENDAVRELPLSVINDFMEQGAEISEDGSGRSSGHDEDKDYQSHEKTKQTTLDTRLLEMARRLQLRVKKPKTSSSATPRIQRTTRSVRTLKFSCGHYNHNSANASYKCHAVHYRLFRHYNHSTVNADGGEKGTKKVQRRHQEGTKRSSRTQEYHVPRCDAGRKTASGHCKRRMSSVSTASGERKTTTFAMGSRKRCRGRYTTGYLDPKPYTLPHP
jgi:hypothetical protein